MTLLSLGHLIPPQSHCTSAVSGEELGEKDTPSHLCSLPQFLQRCFPESKTCVLYLRKGLALGPECCMCGPRALVCHSWDPRTWDPAPNMGCLSIPWGPPSLADPIALPPATLCWSCRAAVGF